MPPTNSKNWVARTIGTDRGCRDETSPAPFSPEDAAREHAVCADYSERDMMTNFGFLLRREKVASRGLKKCKTALSSNEGELPPPPQSKPAPVRVFTLEGGEAETTHALPDVSLLTTFAPVRRVPPRTTIFI